MNNFSLTVDITDSVLDQKTNNSSAFPPQILARSSKLKSGSKWSTKASCS
jgi:hypothetical protein